MFKHILFPTDGTESSRHVESHVLELAQKFASQVTVLHAYEFLELIPVYESTYAYIDELEDYLKTQSHSVAKETEARFQQAGIQTQSTVIKGDPAQTIINVSEEKHCDLIVMGSRQMGVVRRFLLGSVSNYVVHHSECPVLIIPAQTE